MAGLAAILVTACGGGGGGSSTPVVAPVATSLTASSGTPLRGGPFHLTPVYSSGTGAISFTGGTVTCPATGVDTADLTADWSGARVYTLTVTNSANVAATTTATVTPQAVVVGAISPGTPTIAVNGTQTFSTTVTGGFQGTVTWTASAGAINATTGAFTAPASTGDVTITATSADDPAQASTTTAHIVAAVTSSLTASTLAPLYGAPNVTIIPTFTGGTAVVGTTAGGSDISASPVSGVGIGVQTGGFTTAQTYYLRVTDAASVSHDSSVTITPQTVAVANLAPAAPTVTVSGSKTFSTTVTGGYLGTVAWSAAAGTNAGAGSIGATTGVWTAPATAGTVIITATSVDDPSKVRTTTALVVATPTASLAASTATPLYGATDAFVTPTFTGGTAVVGTTAGGSDVSASAVSGTPIAVQASGFTAAATYYLRVTNGAGDHQDANVTMTPQTVSVGAISPAAPDVALSGSATFSATVTGGSPATVTWSVAVGTNANPGSINANTGVYTAPATPGTVIITATSNADHTKLVTTTANVTSGPSITSFKITQDTFTSGSTGATATAVFSGGTGKITGGTIGAGGLAITSGSPVAITPAPTATTTYTLTVHSTAVGSTDATGTAKALVGTLVDLDGIPSGMGNIDGVTIPNPGATKARFWEPNGMVFDGAGNLFVSDYENNCIRRITPGGVVDTPYGSTAGRHGTSDGNGNSAGFFGPAGLAYDGANIWVADAWSFTIRRISAGGTVDTIAGTPGTPGFADAVSGTGDSKGVSQFHFAWSGTGGTPANIPPGLALISTKLYIADQLNHTIRMLDTTTGTVTTPYGTAGVSGGSDLGTGTFNYPTGLTAIGTTLYVAEYGSGNVRAIDTTNLVSPVTTLAGGYDRPVGLASDGINTLYVVEYDGCEITTLTTGGVPGTFAGSAGSVGSTDANGTSARFAYPTALAVDGGFVYVADFGNNTVRRIAVASPHAVTTYAGIAGHFGYSDASTVLFNNPTDLAYDSANGIVYVADTSNHAVRSITLAGNVVATVIKNSVNGTAATFLPTALAVDGAGVVYVADGQNNLLYTVSGNTLSPVNIGGTLLSYPTGLAVDPTGTTLYVSDSNNAKVYKIAGGVATELGALSYTYPAGLALSPDGITLYVADSSSHKIFAQPVGGAAPTVLAGSGTSGYADGTGLTASFGALQGLSIDADGNLYAADTDNNVLRKITPAGVVTTICGVNGTMANVAASGLPVALPAFLARPQAVAVVPTLDAGNQKMFIAIADAVLTISF